MKKITILIIICATVLINILAQSPQSFKYQAILRDTNGKIISNKPVTLHMSILSASEDGDVVYSEEHEVSTNSSGLIVLNIGMGKILAGDFNTINWGGNFHFLKLELNHNNEGFETMGTTPLLSVPYALYAETAGNINDADTDPTNEIQDLELKNNILNITGNSDATKIDLTPYISNNNAQNISIVNDSLSILYGNKVDLSPYLDNTDSQGLILNGNILTIEEGTGSIDLSTYINDADADATNELQQLALIGDTITLSKGGGKVLLPNKGWGGISDEALFAVLNTQGDTVFAVYEGGARVFVEQTNSKGTKSGFAVASRSAAKGTSEDILNVTTDSVRVYFDEVTSKGTKSGFAVASRSAAKGTTDNIFSLTQDKTQIYVKDPNAGFEVTNKGNGSDQKLLQLTEENYFIGHEVAPNLTTGVKNSIFGYLAGNSLNNGYNNVFIGNKSGFSMTGGHENIFIGNYAGYSSLSPTRNVFIGDSAGRDNQTGQYNVYLGAFAGRKSKGANNVVLGGSAASDSDFGNSNVVIGYVAGRLMKSGSNVLIGNAAGWNNTGLIGGNVFIGYYAGEEYTTEDNRLAIAGSDRTWLPLIYGEFDNKLVKINGDFQTTGSIGIGATSYGGGTSTLALVNGTIPTASIANGVLLYAQDVSVSSELKVRDEAGNITTLSPHNFSLTSKSEPMAWSYYSENQHVGQKINVDMLKAVRLIEEISGEKLVYLSNENEQNTKDNESYKDLINKQSEIIIQQQEEIDEIKNQLEELKRLIINSKE